MLGVYTANLGELWPALCTALALVMLLILIMRFQVHAFAALLVVSLGLGLAAGMTPAAVVDAIAKGVGDILREVALILALGAMLGRILEVSGGAEVIACTFLDVFGASRAPLAILAAGYVIGIPVVFNVGFLFLMPIMWRLQKDTGRSLLFYMLPLAISLGVTHSLVPTHPGIAGAAAALGGADPGKTMTQTIVFGSLFSIPVILVGWFAYGRMWAARQFVACPEGLSAEPKVVSGGVVSGGVTGGVVTGGVVTGKGDATHDSPLTSQHSPNPPVSFAVAIFIVLLPLLLGLTGFTAKLLGIANPWLDFAGKPVIALLVPTGLAFVLLGLRRGLSGAKLAKVAEDALRDVGSILFLFGAAGGFKEVIQTTGAGDVIAKHMMAIPGLSPIAIAYLVAVLIRAFLGSATAAILTTSALLQGLVRQYPGQETLFVLAVASGTIVVTQPADSGFWMVKEFGNLSVRDVMLRFNGCKILMSLAGLAILLAVEAWL
jgi:gluconate transporter